MNYSSQLSKEGVNQSLTIEERSEAQKRSESDMASGADVRSDLSHESNISLSSPNKNDSKGEGKIKGSMRSEMEEQITIRDPCIFVNAQNRV